MSYAEVPEFILRNCPLCGRVAVFAVKGCHERRFRIYCNGQKTVPEDCKRDTDWRHTPEEAVAVWNSESDVPLPLFPKDTLG